MSFSRSTINLPVWPTGYRKINQVGKKEYGALFGPVRPDQLVDAHAIFRRHSFDYSPAHRPPHSDLVYYHRKRSLLQSKQALAEVAL
jgi:hypothetical protein